MDFEKYPFEKLNELIAPLKQPSDELISLTIGEPQFPTPDFIQVAMCEHSSLLNKYPHSKGEQVLKEAVQGYIARRYRLSMKESEIVLSFGTREVLFNLPQYLLFGKTMPTIAYPNPFYQIYEGAAKVALAKIIHMPLEANNAFTPSLSEQEKQQVHVVILNSPNNPTGKALSLEEMKQWVKDALKYDFVILSDECYGDIYHDTPPCSILEAAKAVGNHCFKNVLAINSISKRSSAPGLRSGYVAGDETILKGYMQYRTYIGCAVPLPLQKAAAVAWADDEAPNQARMIYQENFKLASRWLDVKIEPYTFYVWLPIKDDIAFTQMLYERYALAVLPGSFLGRNGAGKGYVRIALVHQTQICEEALIRLARAYSEFK